jgi:hypothetical protein
MKGILSRGSDRVQVPAITVQERFILVAGMATSAQAQVMGRHT